MKYYLPLFLLLVSLNSNAGLTKWVDADGKVHYSDGPPPDNVKTEHVRTISSTNDHESAPVAASAPTGPKTIYEQAADLKKAQKAKEEAAQKAAKEEENAKIKQQNCAQSRSQLQTLLNSGRLSTYNDKGEPEVMDDSARQKNIDDAQAAVSKYCN
jgi:hypothetical protein